MLYLAAAITVILSYLLGSLNFAVIFTKAFNKVDIRDFGSGNAGSTNVFRVSGVAAGICTFVFDGLKGFLAVYITKLVFTELYTLKSTELFNPIYAMFLAGLFCMLGHCFPVFFQFRGGKAVATSIGIFAVCCPPAIIFGLMLFAVSVLISKIVSLSSLVATIGVVAGCIYAAFTGFFGEINPVIITLISTLAGVLVFLRHKDNIARLINKTEKKISIKRSKKDG